MEKTKQPKHKCKCFSEESSSLLYGLRREGPSTERIVLERQLNVLSRAAITGSNPQRLWAKSEEPKWWPQCTKLPWKNPREHPKDKKDTLKKKIEVLERELRKRNLITPAMEEELTMWRSSKKSDLELKSDFEAVIAKASGLHYMIDVVKSKMDKTHVISDRIAEYIREIKRCFGECIKVIDAMFERVQTVEQRKQSLWDKMGVSKTELAPSVSGDPLVSDIIFSVTSPDGRLGLRIQNDHYAVSPSDVLVSAPNAQSLPAIASCELPDDGNTLHGARLLHRSISEPDHPAPAFVDSTSARRLEKTKSLSVAALTPSVTEPINLTQLHRNVQQQASRRSRQASQGPSFESLTESSQEGNILRSSHKKSVTFDSTQLTTTHGVDTSVDLSTEAASLSLHHHDVPGYFGKRPREPEDEDVETRKNKTQRQPSRPKSWAGRGLLSSFPTVSLSSSFSGTGGDVRGLDSPVSSPRPASLNDNTGSSGLTREAANVAYPFSPTVPSTQLNVGSGGIKLADTLPESTVEELEIEDGSNFTCEQLDSMEILAVITSDPVSSSEGHYVSTPVTDSGRGLTGLRGTGIGHLEDKGVTVSEHRYSILQDLSVTAVENRDIEDVRGRLVTDIDDREVDELSSDMMRTLSCENIASADQTFIHASSHTALFGEPATASGNSSFTRHFVSEPHYQHGLQGGSPQIARRATNVKSRNTYRRRSPSPDESLSAAIGKFGVF